MEHIITKYRKQSAYGIIVIGIFCLFSVVPVQAESDSTQILYGATEASIDYYTPQNIRAFADHLYTTKDFVRAVTEYERLLYTSNKTSSDLAIYRKIANCHTNMGNYHRAIYWLEALMKRATTDSIRMHYRLSISYAYFRSGSFDSSLHTLHSMNESSYEFPFIALKSAIFFHMNRSVDATSLISSFQKHPSSNASSCKLLTGWTEDYQAIEQKSPIGAGILSTLLPGLGKVYAGNIRDGFMSLSICSFSAWQSYDGFYRKGPRSTKGWLFSSLGALFYFGNIYGSVLEAKKFNRKNEMKFLDKIDFALETQVF